MNTNSESSTDIITISRSILKQALEALEKHQEALRAWPEHTLAPHECVAMDASEKAITALRTALAQQAELSEGLGPLPPTTYVLARESDGYSPERLLSEAGYTEEHMRAYAAAAVTLERDSRQALPVAQFDLNTMPGQADAHLRALLRYTENFYATAIEHGMRAGPTANAIAHVERAGKALHQIVHAQAKMLHPAAAATSLTIIPTSVILCSLS